MINISRAFDEHLHILTKIGSKTLHESHGRSAPAHIMNAYVDENFSEASIKAELSDPNNIFHIIYYNNIVMLRTKFLHISVF